MSRSTKQSINPLPYSYKSPEGYIDTESEADPTDAGDDPLEYDTDKDKDVRDKHDRTRSLDVDPSRRAPTASPYGQDPRDNGFSESDPRQGLSLISRRFIDYNVVENNFIFKSAEYLKLHRTLRSQSVTEWRQRARCAVRAGDPGLARKLIQQAQLIRIWQDNNDIGDLVRGPDSREFPWFIQKTYTTYLTYLAEAEAEGLLRGKRREMLQPWKTFVEQAWNEDIMTTLSRSQGSVSSTFLNRGAKNTDTRPGIHQSRNSVPSLPKSQDSQGLQTLTSHKLGAASISLPLRNSKWGDEEETLTPSHQQERPEARGQGARYERKLTDSREPAQRPRSQPVPSQSQVVSKRQGYVTNPPRTSQKRYEDVVEDAEEDEEHDEDEDEEEEDDDDDEEQEVGKRVDSGFGELRGDKVYEYANGRMNPQTNPRILPSSSQTIHSRSPQDRGTSKAATTGRGQATTPTKSRSPTSTVTSTTQPTSSAQGLSELMNRFIAQKTYHDCRDFCESYPEIFDEDLKPLQGFAVQCLRQNRRDGARRGIERRLMLQDANSSTEDNLEWMKKLVRFKKRQEQLQERCEMVLEALEDALAAVSAPSGQSSGSSGAQRRSGSDANRSNTQRPERQQLGLNT